MGYFYNHLATLVTAIFAGVLTALWFIMTPMFPLLDFVFIMAVPIAWFLVAVCVIAQKSVDYMHHDEKSSESGEKKNYNKVGKTTTIVYTSQGTRASSSQLKEAQNQLSDDLNQLRNTVKLKETEIDRLKQEIANLQTMVQIESLRTELANLKMLASEEKHKRKERKK